MWLHGLSSNILLTKPDDSNGTNTFLGGSVPHEGCSTVWWCQHPDKRNGSKWQVAACSGSSQSAVQQGLKLEPGVAVHWLLHSLTLCSAAGGQPASPLKCSALMRTFCVFTTAFYSCAEQLFLQSSLTFCLVTG